MIEQKKGIFDIEQGILAAIIRSEPLESCLPIGCEPWRVGPAWFCFYMDTTMQVIKQHKSSGAWNEQVMGGGVLVSALGS